MSFLYNFLSQFLFYKQPEISNPTISQNEEDDDIFIVKHLVTIHDIKSIRLNKVKETNKSEKDYDDLKKLILNVKLNHVTIDDKQNKEYKHRHPVLNELREKFKK
jgi:hypothetical protein